MKIRNENSPAGDATGLFKKGEDKYLIFHLYFAAIIGGGIQLYKEHTRFVISNKFFTSL